VPTGSSALALERVHMQDTTTATPSMALQDLFTETAEHRRKGDLAAAHAVDLLAMLTVRNIVAGARREVRQ
jgi:hypothetical protein